MNDLRLAAWRAYLQSHGRLIAMLEEELQRDCGMPLTWYDVLVQLSEAPEGRLRMRELADAVVLSKSGMSRLIDRLVVDGLVAREQCDADKRGTWAVITAAGFDRIRNAHPSHAASVERHFNALMSDSEAEILATTLARVRDALDVRVS